MKLPFRNICFSNAAQKTNKKDLSRARDHKILWLAKLSMSQPGAPSLPADRSTGKEMGGIGEKENPDVCCFHI